MLSAPPQRPLGMPRMCQEKPLQDPGVLSECTPDLPARWTQPPGPQSQPVCRWLSGWASLFSVYLKWKWCCPDPGRMRSWRGVRADVSSWQCGVIRTGSRWMAVMTSQGPCHFLPSVIIRKSPEMWAHVRWPVNTPSWSQLCEDTTELFRTDFSVVCFLKDRLYISEQF